MRATHTLYILMQCVLPSTVSLCRMPSQNVLHKGIHIHAWVRNESTLYMSTHVNWSSKV